jgi:hypothetical protein
MAVASEGQRDSQPPQTSSPSGGKVIKYVLLGAGGVVLLLVLGFVCLWLLMFYLQETTGLGKSRGPNPPSTQPPPPPAIPAVIDNSGAADRTLPDGTRVVRTVPPQFSGTRPTMPRVPTAERPLPAAERPLPAAERPLPAFPMYPVNPSGTTGKNFVRIKGGDNPRIRAAVRASLDILPAGRWSSRSDAGDLVVEIEADRNYCAHWSSNWEVIWGREAPAVVVTAP